MYITQEQMENFIRSNAENIWELLCERGQMTIRQIGEHTHCRDAIIFMSIGYLVKEDKINIEDKSGTLYFESRNTITEIYY
jgi:hypothetical protein